MTNELLSNFLPSDLLTYFDIVHFELSTDSKGQECFKIYLDEKNILPDGFSSDDYESKGFNNITFIQDFPIRGKAVYLGIRTRRWRDKLDKSIEIKRDFSIVAEGSKITQELSVFLKGTGR
jgi:hypothetical protein